MKIGQQLFFNDGISRQHVPVWVTFVHSETVVNVAGFGKSGNVGAALTVKVVPPDEVIYVGQAGTVDRLVDGRTALGTGPLPEKKDGPPIAENI